MAVDAQSAIPNSSFCIPADTERDILFLIGRGLTAHKERLYVCHQTGLTAELAWPIMESILANIRPYLRHTELSETRLKLLPLEPTPEMVRAALLASIRLRQQHQSEDLQPDSPGNLPSEMVRTVWQAMLQTLPASVPACGTLDYQAPVDEPRPTSNIREHAYTVRYAPEPSAQSWLLKCVEHLRNLVAIVQAAARRRLLNLPRQTDPVRTA